MNIWYPEIPAKRLLTRLWVALACAVLAGAYGAVHDQISYTISPEYFTRFKFCQFRYADFGLPERVFAAEVGFLGTWWVGLIGGWILARLGLAGLMASGKPHYLFTAFALAAGVTAVAGGVGVLLGTAAIRNCVDAWREWQEVLGLQDLPAFVVVAYLHAAGYLGGVLGLVCAVVYVRRSLPRRTGPA
jgi:hypothetical protein